MPDLPRVSHYGTIQIGDLSFDGVVLEDGTRGYVQRQLTQAVGFQGNIRVLQFRRFLGEIAPNALSLLDKSGSSKVVMPHGGHAGFLPAGILSEIVTGVLDAAIAGTLHRKQRHLIPQCQLINKALTVTGEVALIDEATGYQYHRAPDALQDLFGRLIREHCSDWERRFHPDYYASLFRLFGWKYEGQSQRPIIIGQITDQLVYGAVFPPEIMAEVRERRGGRLERLHQWLKDGGLRMLENQIRAVCLMADSSTDYADFKNRCMVTFKIPGQVGFIFPSPSESNLGAQAICANLQKGAQQ